MNKNQNRNNKVSKGSSAKRMESSMYLIRKFTLIIPRNQARCHCFLYEA